MNPSLEKYNTNANGYICISRVVNEDWKQQFFKTNELIKANEFIDANKNYDTYNSIATFNTSIARKEHIKEINSHSIDIDNHLSPLSIDDAINFNEQVLEPLYDLAIPIPSLVVYTGRGLQLHFNLKGADDVIKWEITQKALMKRIENIISKQDSLINISGIKLDKQVNNASRVMRTPDTLNTKSNTIAQVIYASDEIYTQNELINMFDLDSIELESTNKKKKKTKELKGLANITPDTITKANARELRYFKKYNPLYTIATLIFERKRDLLKLIDLRNANNINEGYRNTLISILVQLEKATGQQDYEILETLQAYNNYFNIPLRDSEILSWFNCAMSKPQMHFSNKYIIDKLDISIEEQEQLSTIISRKVKNKRYYNSHREQILSNMNDKYLTIKMVNTATRNSLINDAVKLRQQGYTIKEIATSIGKCDRQVRRYLKGK